ncbi:MAG TPA: bifunctional adenosylcobinamide kinase/adenosylcobinamide-phosphate guanylyltransferase [Acetobacteraceae bacterium]|nr:bifunctional adenosylcobinamide kinase/adenosylcobinamide-phosphate guanylyltransferase [Acetobacteraceae bacterium]
MPHPANPHLAFVVGGARSGKSRHAEALVATHPAPWLYLATAEIRDDEMRARIDEHRRRRGSGWRICEVPLRLGATLAAETGPALVDCLTLWLTNVMLGEHDVGLACDELVDVLSARTAPTVVVSNEVGLGIVPDNALARRFRDAAGVLHQRVAAISGSVVFMVAGLPMVVK